MYYYIFLTDFQFETFITYADLHAVTNVRRLHQKGDPNN